MKRVINNQLIEWKDSDRRKPLIIRGMRQVGKTYAVNHFGKENFHNVVYIDFEKQQLLHQIFDGNLNTEQIISELELTLKGKITPGRTLLFLDEIQACPRALMALRYFYEDLPELHVIAAGSLLEFALGEISYPVGRVQFLQMFPMNFSEFLAASQSDKLATIVSKPPKKLSNTVHILLINELKNFLFVGGMPEAVSAYLKKGSIRDSFAVHRELCTAFENDFSKYAGRVDKNCLKEVFKTSATKVGKQVKYSHLSETYSTHTIKRSLELLMMAEVVRKIPSSSAAGLPLGATANRKTFKLVFGDIGLMHHLCGFHPEKEFLTEDLLDIYRGQLAEQFVGQELIQQQHGELYYWSRAVRGSSAEVDYLINCADGIVPVEVKSGASGSLKSLHICLQEHDNVDTSYIFSSRPYNRIPQQKLTFIPIYYAGSQACSAY